MDVGRWYRDNSGQEFRFIGNVDDTIGLFSTGESTIEKPLSDFQDMPKETKLFKFFGKGGITANDLLEARNFFGESEWKKLKRQDRINSARYLKRTGKIGYKKGGKINQGDLPDFISMQYDKGGEVSWDEYIKPMIENLNKLLNSGKIKIEDYTRAVFNLKNPKYAKGGMVSKSSVISELQKLGFSKEKAQNLLEEHIDIYEINEDDEDSKTIALQIEEQYNQEYDKGGEIASIKKGISFYKRKAKKGNKNAKINLELLQGILERKQNPIVRTQFEEEEFEYEDGGKVRSKYNSGLKEDFLEDMQELHTDIKEITLRDGSKISQDELRQAHRFDNGGEMDSDDDDDDDIDYNSISDLQSERNRLVRWSNQYGSKGADYKIKQLEERIKYLKSKKMASGGGITDKEMEKVSQLVGYYHKVKFESDAASSNDENAKSIRLLDRADNYRREAMSLIETYNKKNNTNFSFQDFNRDGTLREGISSGLKVPEEYTNSKAEQGRYKYVVETKYPYDKQVFITNFDETEKERDPSYKAALDVLTKAKKDKDFEEGHIMFSFYIKGFGTSYSTILHTTKGKMAKGGKIGKRYTVNVYYGGEMEDDQFHTDSLSEAKRLSQRGEHSEIYDNSKKQFIEFANGGSIKENRENVYELILKNPNGGMTRKVIFMANSKDEASNKALGLREFKGMGWVVKSVNEDKYAKGGKLVGKQKNLDLNKNGKLDSEDFKMLRGEKMADGGEISDWANFVKENRGYFRIDKQTDGMIHLNTSATKPVHKIMDLQYAEEIIKIVKEKYPKTKASLYSPDDKLVELELTYVKNDSFAKGGKVRFQDKANAIADSLEGKKVASKYRKQYGAKYDRSEAEMAGKRIAGAMRKKYGI